MGPCSSISRIGPSTKSIFWIGNAFPPGTAAAALARPVKKAIKIRSAEMVTGRVCNMNLPTGTFQEASLINSSIRADANGDDDLSVFRCVNGERHGRRHLAECIRERCRDHRQTKATGTTDRLEFSCVALRAVHGGLCAALHAVHGGLSVARGAAPCQQSGPRPRIPSVPRRLLQRRERRLFRKEKAPFDGRLRRI
jgi:hypothetical protein